MLILSILWVAALLGVFHWSTPDNRYPKAFEQRLCYDIVWLMTVMLLIYLHYSLMAIGGYGILAIILDLISVGLFVTLACVRAFLEKSR